MRARTRRLISPKPQIEANVSRLAKVYRDFFATKAVEVAHQIAPLVQKIQKADPPSDDEVQRILDAIRLGDWDVLINPTSDEIAAVTAAGIQAALKVIGFADEDTTLNEARDAMGLDPVEGGDEVPNIVRQVNQRAVDYADARAADLVTQISENTRDMLRATVADAVEEGWGANKLADEISDSAAFSDYRAMMIARTELIDANNQGNLDAYRDSGVVRMKEWKTAGDDLVSEGCQENEDEGPIDIDDTFPSGDDAPPAHPNCRCVLLPVLVNEATGEETEDESGGDIESVARPSFRRYSEDQPRDDHGRWEGGGGGLKMPEGSRILNGYDQTVYHHTSPENVDSILNEGVRPSKGGMLGSGYYFSEGKTEKPSGLGSHENVVISVPIKADKVLELDTVVHLVDFMRANNMPMHDTAKEMRDSGIQGMRIKQTPSGKEPWFVAFDPKIIGEPARKTIDGQFRRYSEDEPREKTSLGRWLDRATALGKGLIATGDAMTDPIPVSIPVLSDDDRASVDHDVWEIIGRLLSELRAGPVPRDPDRLEEIPLSAMWATQEHVSKERLEEHIAEGATHDPPILYDMGDGRYAVLDGHHRIEAAKRLGIQMALCDVLTSKPDISSITREVARRAAAMRSK